MLKRLADALRDRDPVLAVIRGSAVNQDGASNGITAPNTGAQQALLRRALAQARVDPAWIGYVETHGTGTSLGDPIEVEALSRVLGQPCAETPVCWLGAVKSNLGHLEAAAGIAGLIKAVLCLREGLIPPNLHFTKLNPHISWEGTRFAVPTQVQRWEPAGRGRYAGVSSFGFGGTNAHVVLQEAVMPAVEDATEPPTTRVDRAYVLPLSARSDEALHALARSYQQFLADPAQGAALPLADIAYTAAVRRLHHDHRWAVVGRSHAEWIAALQSLLERRSAPAHGTRLAMLEELADRYAAGGTVDWQQQHPSGGRCVLLPRYPWQRKRHWLPRQKDRQSVASAKDFGD